MKPPPFILGAALLFWGWRADMLWVGGIGAVLLELSQFVRGRWEFTDKEFNRLWDICTVLFVGAAAYLRFSEEITSAAYKFFEWMPVIFFPMILGYTYSVRDAVPIKAFSWLLRRKGAQGADRPVPFGWVYIVVCLVATGATNAQDIWFFACSSVLIGWALWSIRPRRLPALAWAILYAGIAIVAFYGQSRMLEAQAFFENKVSEMIVRFGGRRDFDPDQAKTAMGRIGSLKQSSRIVMKLKPELGHVPERITECTYGRLDGTTWKSGFRGGQGFEPVAVEADATTWRITTNSEPRAAVRIIQRVNRKSALLTVPFGTKQLRELSAGAVETNRFGVIRVKDNPGLLNFVARYGPEYGDWEGARRAENEEEAIDQIAEELKIDRLPARQKVYAIINFFQDNYRYSTYQRARTLGLHDQTPLSDFLLNLREGHCEYFATATVLLLRHYGIPARYATGYAVEELAKGEDAYIIRERHGHAWAVALLDGQWIEVDSTPSGWAQAEASEFSRFQELSDAWSSFTFGFLEWRWLGDWGFFRLVAPWLVIPLTLFLIWRTFGRRMSREKPSPRTTQKWPGADSEFFQLERRLAKSGHARWNEETMEHWLSRVGAELPPLTDGLKDVVRLHQMYRFGCDGFGEREREELRRSVRVCLSRL